MTALHKGTQFIYTMVLVRTAGSLDPLFPQLFDEVLFEWGNRAKELRVSFRRCSILEFQERKLDSANIVGDLGESVCSGRSIAIYRGFLGNGLLDGAMKCPRYNALASVLVDLNVVKALYIRQVVTEKYRYIAFDLCGELLRFVKALFLIVDEGLVGDGGAVYELAE